MRSLLFVPGDQRPKLDKALGSGADVLICDLEDSVSAANKPNARATTAAFLKDARGATAARLYVRVNALDTGLTDDDLAAVMAAAPDGIMLPKSASGADVTHLGVKLAVYEARHGLPDGHTRIVAIATETAGALFGLGSYAGASHRLDGMAWGGEDLGADLGVLASKEPGGGWTEPFRLARCLCLFGAVHAGVQAIDTVHTAFRDLEALEAETRLAARDGFTAKLAIHPAQVPVINAVFTPSAAEIARARAIVEAFASAGDAGVLSVNGEMLDRPHWLKAQRLLKRAGVA
jgi:citrate lyase subunit beta/citryl-CoA lyase